MIFPFKPPFRTWFSTWIETWIVTTGHCSRTGRPSRSPDRTAMWRCPMETRRRKPWTIYR